MPSDSHGRRRDDAAVPRAAGGAAGAALGANLIGQNGNYNGLLQVSMLIYVFAIILIIISIKIRKSTNA